MKTKQLLIILGVFVAVVLLAGINGLTQKQKHSVQTEMLMSFAVEDVAAIEYIKGAEVYVFEKNEEGWMMMTPVEYPANEDLLNDMLTALSEVKTEGIVSENPEKHADFQVTEDLTTKITLGSKAGESMGTILLGKRAPGVDRSYARMDDNRVYGILSDLTPLTQYTQTMLRDRTITNIDPNIVNSLILKNADHKHTFLRSENTWSIEGLENVDQSIVDQVANAVPAMTAQDFLDTDAPELSEENHEVKVYIDSAAGPVTLYGLSTETQKLLKNAENDQVFVISDYLYELLTKPESEFIPATNI